MVDLRWSWSNLFIVLIRGVVKRQLNAANSQSIGNKTGQSVTDEIPHKNSLSSFPGGPPKWSTLAGLGQIFS